MREVITEEREVWHAKFEYPFLYFHSHSPEELVLFKFQYLQKAVIIFFRKLIAKSKHVRNYQSKQRYYLVIESKFRMACSKFVNEFDHVLKSINRHESPTFRLTGSFSNNVTDFDPQIIKINFQESNF